MFGCFKSNKRRPENLEQRANDCKTEKSGLLHYLVGVGAVVALGGVAIYVGKPEHRPREPDAVEFTRTYHSFGMRRTRAANDFEDVDGNGKDESVLTYNNRKYVAHLVDGEVQLTPLETYLQQRKE